MKSEDKEIFVIGIDEAGRGPLAGPLVVGGALLLPGKKHLLAGIKDSKQLTPKQRNKWLGKLSQSVDIFLVTTIVSPAEIDKLNIAKAANLGASRVFKKILKKHPKIRLDQLKVLLDGSLYLQKDINFQTIIKGDEKIPAIAAASIAAKETRDKLMLRLHKKYPGYGFDRHKGYGTKLHMQKIAELGSSPVHRRSFLKNIREKQTL